MYPVQSSRQSSRLSSPPSQFVSPTSPHPRANRTPPQHWKREWVRPTSLSGKPGTYKVLKWVLDTSSAPQEGTQEELAAALKVVTSGEALGETGSGFASGTATPAEGGGGGSRAQQLVAQAGAASVTTSTGSTPEHLSDPAPINPSKPTTGPPEDPTLAVLPPAVVELAQLPPGAGVDVEMGDVAFVEDEVQLAQEAVAEMQTDA